MRIRMQPGSSELDGAVLAFNARLAAGGVLYRLPVTGSNGHGENHPVSARSFLAVDTAGLVHGGYTLKERMYYVAGAPHRVAFYQLPLSEGLIDRAYGTLGLQLLRDALARQPLLFVLGVGGRDEPLAQMLLALKWPIADVPFYFRLLRPFRALRSIARQRGGRSRIALEALAWSGTGWLAATSGRALGRATRPGGLTIANLHGEDARVDAIWRAAAGQFRFIAVRDAGTVARLYDDGSRPYVRVLVLRHGEPVGWAVALDTAMRNHRHFGSLRVGTIVDGLARPGEEAGVVHAVTGVLAEAGVDLVITNQSARPWRAALRAAGFQRAPSSFLFGASARLRAAVGTDLGSAHLTRGDGDGPIHL